jgi:hypothetical protein
VTDFPSSSFISSEEMYLKFGHDHILPRPLQFFVIRHPTVQRRTGVASSHSILIMCRLKLYEGTFFVLVTMKDSRGKVRRKEFLIL